MKEKTKKLLLAGGAGIGLAGMILAAVIQSSDLSEGFFLKRREVLYEKALTAEIDGEETSLVITVVPRELSKEECQELLANVCAKMDSYILGENTFLDEVRSDLNLIADVEGTPVTVSWELDSYEVLYADGRIRQERVPEEGMLVELTATLTCGEETAVYRTVVLVLPPFYSEEEQFERELQETIAGLQEESKSLEWQELPKEVQGRNIVWKENRFGTAGILVLLALGCVPLFHLAHVQEEKKQRKEREAQMRRDYAQVAEKLVLLVSAGMTIRNGWERLVRDYQTKREKEQIAPRYVYEEMVLTYREMQNGIAEAKAYENFGLRIRIPCYRRLTNLLQQNLKKGSKGLAEQLQQEVREAFEERKELARSKGEEASTRLLLPMMMLLLVVLLLIVVPAWLSMQW